MPVRTLTLALMLAISATHAVAAPQDLVESVNAVRARGCAGRPGVAGKVRADPRLDRVAAELAAGRELRQALLSAGYRAVQVAVLEATGNPASIERSLAEGGCKDVTDAAYRDVGVAQGDGVIRFVLAAPLEAPAAGEAAAVGERVLALVNAARADRRRCGLKRFEAVPPLAASRALQAAAAAHAEDMARRGVIDHAGGDGSTPAMRATRAGYALAHGRRKRRHGPVDAGAGSRGMARQSAPLREHHGRGFHGDGRGGRIERERRLLGAGFRRAAALALPVRGAGTFTPYFASSMSTASRR